MKIYTVDLMSTTLTLDSADLYTLANCNLLIDAPADGAVISGVFLLKATGTKLCASTDEIGGSSIPLVAVEPSYYPKAMAGAECGAVVSTLDWANLNLHKGYQYVVTKRGFFVSGVLNSTQTDANDPFTSTDIVDNQVACWREAYEVTYNPF